MIRSKRAPLRRALASVLTGALIASAAIIGVAAPAQAAGGPSVSAPLAPRAGGTVTVTGQGFSTEAFGIYLGLRATGAAEDIVDTTIWIDDTNVDGSTPGLGKTANMTANGSFSVSVTVPAYVAGTNYSIVTRKAHGGVDPTQSTTTAVAYEAAAQAVNTTTTLSLSPTNTAEVGTSVSLIATVAPAAAGSVEFFDGAGSLGSSSVSAGAATVATSSLSVGAHGLTAVFTPSDATAFVGSTSAAVAYTVTAVPETPAASLSVSKSSGLDPAGETITVTGTGYNPEQAIYVIYCEDVPLSTVTFAFAGPCRTGALQVDKASSSSALKLAADGSFTASLKVLPVSGGTAVYTLANHTAATDRSQDAKVAVEFAIPAPKPTVTVTPSTALDPNVENVLTITGANFVGAGAAQGAYVLFGETSVWSGGSALPGAGWIEQGWVTPRQITGGAFTTTITIPAGTLDPAKSYQVATSAAHGLSTTDRTLDTFTPVTVANVAVKPALTLSAASVQQGGTLTVDGTGFTEGDLVTITVNSDPITLGTATVAASGAFSVSGTIPATFAAGTHTVMAAVNGIPIASQALTVTAAAPAAAVEAPAEPSCVARAVSGATIQWSVKESFRTYIQGPIAKGSYSINWGSGSGAYSTDSDRGRVSYGGTASFTGHSGLLSVEISNPRVQVNSNGSATLIVNVRSTNPDGSAAVNANGVAFANLSLPAANESGNRISWTGASATLTATGAKAFAGFYEAGAALDPVSFSFPLGAEVECDSTTTGSLAATGGDAGMDELWLAIGMLVLGAGIFAIRRRTVRA